MDGPGARTRDRASCTYPLVKRGHTSTPPSRNGQGRLLVVVCDCRSGPGMRSHNHWRRGEEGLSNCWRVAVDVWGEIRAGRRRHCRAGWLSCCNLQPWRNLSSGGSPTSAQARRRGGGLVGKRDGRDGRGGRARQACPRNPADGQADEVSLRYGGLRGEVEDEGGEG